MSRIGQAIIKIPDGIEVKHEGNNFWAKGLKGELTAPVSSTVNVTIKAVSYTHLTLPTKRIV